MGDELVLHLNKELPRPYTGAADRRMHRQIPAENSCGSGQLTASSTNLHFHGINVPPTCHQDDVIRTLIQPGDPASSTESRFSPTKPSLAGRERGGP